MTHQYEFARGCADEARSDTLFLRAERTADGTRTFKLKEGMPLQTSFGADVYREVFGTREEPDEQTGHDLHDPR